MANRVPTSRANVQKNRVRQRPVKTAPARRPQMFASTVAEPLESRRLLSGAPAQLLFSTPSAEINVRFDATLESGGKLFLTGHRNEDPESLYVTDGQGTATKLMTAITFSSATSVGISAITAFAGKVYFLGNCVSNGQAADGLFVSDGTVAGTQPVKLIRTGTIRGLPNSMYVVDGKLYFQWVDLSTTTLWSSDGTAPGTAPVPASTSVTLPDQPSSAPPVSWANVFVAAGKTFAIQTSLSGLAMASKPNPEGTGSYGPPVRYLDTRSGSFASAPYFLGTYQGRLAMEGTDGVGAPVVWSIDPDVVPGSITGASYVDENHNGKRDGFERRLIGSAYLDQDGDGGRATNEYSAASDTAGTFTLGGLPPGTYPVRFQPTGTDATLAVSLPAGGVQAVAVTAGQATGGANFSADGTSTLLWGSVYNDANANGVRDAGELAPPSAAQRVYVDLNGNGLYDAAAEPTTLTAADGTYGIAVSAAGTYTIRRADQTGWRQTSPVNRGGLTVTVAAGQAAEVPAIGAAVAAGAAVTGRAWADADADGVREPGETLLANLSISLVDASGATVATTTTSAAGAYTFNALFGDAPYRVKFNLAATSSLTLADRGADDAADSDADPQTALTAPFAVPDGQTLSGVDAGVLPRTSVTGTVYRDANDNGRRDANEPGLASVAVFLDANANGSADAGETTVLTSSAGAYTLFASPGPRTVGAVAPGGFLVVGSAAARTANVALGAMATTDLALAPAAAGPSLNAGPVGPEYRLNATTVGSQTLPAVAANAAGEVVAVWYDATVAKLVGRRFDAAGNPAGDEFTISTTAAPASGTSQVAYTADGGFAVAWIGANVIYARRFAADGTPVAAAFAVSQTVSGTRTNPRLAANPAGGFAVGWAGPAAGDSDAAAFRRYDAAGNPLGGETLASEVTANSQFLGDLTYDAAGRLIVAYSGDGPGGTSTGVLVRRFAADGTPVGASALVSVTAAGVKTATGVAVGPSGRTVVLWVVGGDVYARTYGSDGAPLGGEVRVDASTTAAQTNTVSGFPRLSAAADGTFLVTWTSLSQDGDSGGTFAQLLNADGVPTGREFRLNTTTAGNQRNVALAAGPGGTYLAAWASAGQDGSLDGIYAQRLETFTARSAVAGTAWVDADGDGVRGAGEAPLANVAIELYTSAGSIVDTAVTGTDGTYRFGAVRPGQAYAVRFGLPASRYYAPANQGADDSVDSDADTTTGYTAPFAATVAGATLGGVDAGFNIGAQVGGTLYYDANANGTRDAGEAVQPGGWTVFLDADGDGVLDAGEQSTATGTSGTYTFTNLSPGTYRVAAVALTHWAQTTPAAGLSRTVTPGQVATANVGFRPTAPLDARATPAGVETRVNTVTTGDQAISAAAADAAGNYAIVYASAGTVVGQRYTAAGIPVGGEFTVSATGAAPAVAMAADGRFVVTWQDAGEIYARRFAADGAAAGAARRVNTTTADTQSAPDVAARADGTFAVVWQSANQDGSGQGAYAQRYGADGTPVGTEFRATGTTVSDQTGPKVGMDAAGNLEMAYLSGPIGGVVVYGQRFDAANLPLGAEFKVNTSSASGFEWADVAANAAGEFVITFRGSSTIEARRYDTQGAPQGLTVIANTTGTAPDVPSVAIGEDGRFVVVWNVYGESAEANSSGVRAQFFNAAGLRLGSEIRVNTTIPYSQYAADVVVQPGGFVVTWTSQNQDGDGTGVYAQRYTTFAAPASVGGIAFVDANNNNVRDPAEVGRDGVAVRLVDAFGNVVQTAVSAGGGRYRFDDVAPGAAYRVGFAAAAGTAISPTADAGADDTIDSDADPITGLTTPFTVAAGQADLTRDAGLVPLATIAGTAFADADTDGVRDAGETPLAGWTAFLDADGDATLDAGERTATTAADGTYTFAGLRPGPYRVEVVPQSRWGGTTPITLRLPVLTPGQTYALDLGAVATAQPVLVAPTGGERAADLANFWEFNNRGDRIAADAIGNTVAVGYTYRGAPNEYDVVAARYDAAGHPVGSTFTVSAATAGSQLDPFVAMTLGGRFVVVWQGSIDSTLQTEVYARVFGPDGQPLTGDLLVNQVTAGRQADPSVAVEPDGDFVVAFEGPDAAGTGVYARRFNADGTAKGNEFAVSGVATGDQTDPQVATNASGAMTVAWLDGRDSAYTLVYARQIAADGSAGPDVQVSAVVPGAGGWANPSIDMNAGGEWVVAWDMGTGVKMSRYDAAGVRQGGEQWVNNGADGAARAPDVGIGDDGHVVVAWGAPDGDSTGVYVRRYSGSGVPSAGPARVNADPAGRQADPIVALLANGGDLVDWVTDPGFGRVQRFDPVAQPAVSTAGGFVWSDDGRDGVFDAGDAPAAGVKVDLLDATGAAVGTAVTAANGAFRFDGVRAGASYRLRYQLPNGDGVSAQDVGTDDTRDSDADASTAITAFLAPTAGRVDLTYGLGLTSGGSATAPTILSWASAATPASGAGGETAWNVPDEGTFVEHRGAGLSTLLVSFSGPVLASSLTSGGVSVQGTNANGTPTDLSKVVVSVALRSDGTTAALTFGPPLPDAARYVVRLSGLTGPSGLPLAGDADRAFAVLRADLDADAAVGFADFNVLAAHYGKSVAPWTVGDIDGDGAVGFADFNLLASQYGKSLPPAGGSATPPPPTSAVPLPPLPTPVPTPVPTPTPTPTTTPATVAKVNFQPAAAPAVAGYLVDSGQTYAARSGLTYGWSISHADTAYDRNVNADQRLDTSVGVKAGGKWELAVPNGTYTVKVGVGDASRATTDNVWVEGQSLFASTRLAANAFASKSVIVNVTDGKLTVGIGSAASSTTFLDYVEVAKAQSPSPTPTPTPATTTLRASADAYVRDGTYAGTNYGSAADLQVRKSSTGGASRWALLKFDLTNLTTISSATLRLYGKLDSTANPSLAVQVSAAANATWTEAGVTWTNKPAAGGSPLGTVTVAGTTAKSYTVDLTAYLKAQKAAGTTSVTLVLQAGALTSAAATFASDEASANRPQLTVKS